nr:MAG TPA: hypothetical protein [Caudoviricetes sp.]
MCGYPLNIYHDCNLESQIILPAIVPGEERKDCNV